jgi:hypothetical protein
MKTISDHIKHIHTKPHHVRRKVAVTAAVAGTALIALVWIVGSAAHGVFALTDSSFADATAAPEAVTVVDQSGNIQNAQVAGAAAAPAVEDKNTPAHINIVDVTPKPSPKPEQTTIPF